MSDENYMFNNDLRQAELVIEGILESYRKKYSGMTVRMKKGKYKGRNAVISGVISDDYRGRLAFLCMVQRVDGQGALNSDGESRSYLPSDWFELI